MESQLVKNEKNLYYSKMASISENDIKEKGIYSLNLFNDKIRKKKSTLKYFQIEINLQLDETNSLQTTKLKGFEKINDFVFRIEVGCLDKYFVDYKFIIERPDVIFRNDVNRKNNIILENMI